MVPHICALGVLSCRMKSVPNLTSCVCWFIIFCKTVSTQWKPCWAAQSTSNWINQNPRKRSNRHWLNTIPITQHFWKCPWKKDGKWQQQRKDARFSLVLHTYFARNRWDGDEITERKQGVNPVETGCCCFYPHRSSLLLWCASRLFVSQYRHGLWW